MKDIYWYFILLLVLLLILPENKRFMVILIAAIMSVLMLAIITIDYHYPLDNKQEKVFEEQEKTPEISKDTNETDKSEYINQLTNQPYNDDVVNAYYDKPAYEELFADYGLAKAQKRVLHNNDIMRENESKFQYSKFAPYFGDELDIYYDKVWFGPDN